MGEIVPGVAIFAVVLADRTPLPLAEVGSPLLPGDVRLARLVQPLLLGDIDQRIHVLPPLFLPLYSAMQPHRQPSIPFLRSSEGGLDPSQIEKTASANPFPSKTPSSLFPPCGEVLSLLDNETGMHSCLDHKPSVAGWRRRQEEASPWRREYRPRSGQARSSVSC